MRLFSQSIIGYWATKSSVSIYCRIISFGLLFISNWVNGLAYFLNYHIFFFAGVHFCIIIFFMLVYGLYLLVSLFLMIKHAWELCLNSPVMLLMFIVHMCVRVAGAILIGFPV